VCLEHALFLKSDCATLSMGDCGHLYYTSLLWKWTGWDERDWLATMWRVLLL
jgi:hypothetical protein